MKRIDQVGASRDARAPQADITNASHLFGDVEDGDFESLSGDFEDGDADYGDADYGDADYGDVMTGDPDMLAAYKLISGDPMGDISRKAKMRGFAHKARIPAIIGASALTSAALARGVKNVIAKKKREKAAIRAKMLSNRNKQTILNQQLSKNMLGKISRSSNLPFFSLMGAKMNAAPIEPTSTFVADVLQYNLNRQNTDTPFFQETAIGTLAGPTWTAQANGVAGSRYYTGLIVQIGTNELNAAPGTVINITATLPTINGPLVIAAQPFVLTYEKGYDVRFLIFPYQLVANKPLPVLGSYNNANPIIVQVTGIPAQSSVNLVVPGSLHPWSSAMRRSLL